MIVIVPGLHSVLAAFQKASISGLLIRSFIFCFFEAGAEKSFFSWRSFFFLSEPFYIQVSIVAGADHFGQG